jgi:hypothetical protein
MFREKDRVGFVQVRTAALRRVCALHLSLRVGPAVLTSRATLLPPRPPRLRPPAQTADERSPALVAHLAAEGGEDVPKNNARAYLIPRCAKVRVMRSQRVAAVEAPETALSVPCRSRCLVSRAIPASLALPTCLQADETLAPIFGAVASGKASAASAASSSSSAAAAAPSPFPASSSVYLLLTLVDLLGKMTLRSHPPPPPAPAGSPAAAAAALAAGSSSAAGGLDQTIILTVPPGPPSPADAGSAAAAAAAAPAGSAAEGGGDPAGDPAAPPPAAARLLCVSRLLLPMRLGAALPAPPPGRSSGDPYLTCPTARQRRTLEARTSCKKRYLMFVHRDYFHRRAAVWSPRELSVVPNSLASRAQNRAASTPLCAPGTSARHPPSTPLPWAAC